MFQNVCFSDINIKQGSVNDAFEMWGIFYCCFAAGHLLLSLPVKEFKNFQNRSTFGKVRGKNIAGTLFRTW